jgi:hypothetical protein
LEEANMRYGLGSYRITVAREREPQHPVPRPMRVNLIKLQGGCHARCDPNRQ